MERRKTDRRSPIQKDLDQKEHLALSLNLELIKLQLEKVSHPEQVAKLCHWMGIIQSQLDALNRRMGIGKAS